MNRKHAQGSLDRDEAAQPAVATLQLLAGEAVHHVAHAGRAVALQVHPEHAQPRQLADDLHRERCAFVVLGDDRQETLIDEAAHR